MRQLLRKILQKAAIASTDKSFLKLMHGVENIVSKVMAIALIFIIFIALFDLLRTLAFDLFISDPKGVLTLPLLKIFGMFLNILIALELAENITAYLRQHTIQLELVIITALTAVARKIVIFDSKADGDLTGLALSALALAISYWIIRAQKRA